MQSTRTPLFVSFLAFFLVFLPIVQPLAAQTEPPAATDLGEQSAFSAFELVEGPAAEKLIGWALELPHLSFQSSLDSGMRLDLEAGYAVRSGGLDAVYFPYAGVESGGWGVWFDSANRSVVQTVSSWARTLDDGFSEVYLAVDGIPRLSAVIGEAGKISGFAINHLGQWIDLADYAAELQRGDFWGCFGDCLSSLGVSISTQLAIWLACRFSCAFGTGIGCSFCLAATLTHLTVQTSFCHGYCG